MGKRAVVLVSGGLDSTTCLGLALDQGFEPIALSFSYGQRHSVELQAARRVVEHYGVKTHRVVKLEVFGDIGGSALTADIAVPQHDNVEDLGSEIPVTYVPARNLVFLSQAIAVAETAQANSLFIGVNALDYSGYPDCRPEFISAFEEAANLATKAGVEGAEPLKIHAPLMHMAKSEIIRRGMELGVPYGLTHSCYSPIEDLACGHCDSCLLRLKGFEEAGSSDPVEYAQAQH